MATATGIAAQAGNTDVGMSTISPAIMVPKTAFTISSNRKMTIMNSERVRLPITDSDKAPIDLAP